MLYRILYSRLLVEVVTFYSSLHALSPIPPAGVGKAPYTPFSQTLATDLYTLHSTLLRQIPDCPAPVLPHLFQCLAVLVIHTPFSKLNPGLISLVGNWGLSFRYFIIL